MNPQEVEAFIHSQKRKFCQKCGKETSYETLHKCQHQVQKPDGWISVTERLPDDNQRLFAYTTGNKRIIASFYNGHWFDEQSLERDVTHWQPLPPSPEKT